MGSTPKTTYRPLGSVWHGGDAELIERMLDFYACTPPQVILDATVNQGRFWRGTTRTVIGLDIESRHRPTVVGDNMRMPFADGCMDVVVYDPPHVPNQGRDRKKDFNTRFGLGIKSGPERGYSFSHFYRPFAVEAFRVLKSDGLLLCKIADFVHNHRMHLAHIDMVLEARSVGFMACDIILKVRKGPIVDPKWKVAHHARKEHCYWLVFRKSNRCECRRSSAAARAASVVDSVAISRRRRRATT